MTQSTPLPFPDSEHDTPVFPAPVQELEVQFAEEFTNLQGKFVFCMNVQELIARLSDLIAHERWNQVFCSEPALLQILPPAEIPVDSSLALKDADVSLTTCECLVARTGTIVLSAAQQQGRTASLYAPVHICIAFTNQLVYDVKDAFIMMRHKYPGRLPSLITFASGPSRTADIEKTLVVGVHGPKEVYLFLVEQH